jgi:hypothetical protein
MNSGSGQRIAASAVALLWRDEMTVLTRRARVVPVICAAFDGLHSKIIGKVMFESSIKPNQSKSNQIKLVQIFPSRKNPEGVVWSRHLAKRLEVRRFDSILLS